MWLIKQAEYWDEIYEARNLALGVGLEFEEKLLALFRSKEDGKVVTQNSSNGSEPKIDRVLKDYWANRDDHWRPPVPRRRRSFRTKRNI